MSLDLYLTIAESCEAIGVTRTAIYNWMNEGILPFFKKGSLRLIEKKTLAKINLERLKDRRGVRGTRLHQKEK